MANELNLTSIDHEEIKQSLISFLKSTDEFSDFDYDGSSINTIIDLLVRNTTYDSYLANMLANESFIKSAQIRANVVDHAQKLSYVPRSRTASRATVDLTVTPSDPSQASVQITIDPGVQMLANIGGETYTFSTTSAYTSTLSNGKYTISDVEVLQGQYLINSFLYDRNVKQVTIPNLNVDTSTIQVTVNEGGNPQVFTKATTLEEVSSTRPVYFLSESSDGRFTVSFGRDVLGKEPVNGSTVQVSYINTENSHANGVTSMVTASTIGGYSDINTTVVDASSGGQDREDIDDVRWIAPKYYQAQDRALNDFDYIPLLKEKYPYIKSAISWGGEDNDPPQYGNVFVSIVTTTGGTVTSSVKNDMVQSLKMKNVGSITPIIVDADYVYLVLDVQFAYDYRLTTNKFPGLKNLVTNTVFNYSDNSLNKFGEFFNQSALNNQILAIEGITSVSTNVKAMKNLSVLRFNNPIYEINFDNEILEGSVSMTDFIVDSTGTNHTLYDSEGALFLQYTKQDQSINTIEVGAVDYKTGKIEFVLNMIQDESSVDIYVEPKNDNMYALHNRVLSIDSVTASLMETKTR